LVCCTIPTSLQASGPDRPWHTSTSIRRNLATINSGDLNAEFWKREYLKLFALHEHLICEDKIALSRALIPSSCLLTLEPKHSLLTRLQKEMVASGWNSNCVGRQTIEIAGGNALDATTNKAPAQSGKKLVSVAVDSNSFSSLTYGGSEQEAKHPRHHGR
jgi:hypothetical protein